MTKAILAIAFLIATTMPALSAHEHFRIIGNITKLAATEMDGQEQGRQDLHRGHQQEDGGAAREGED